MKEEENMQNIFKDINDLQNNFIEKLDRLHFSKTFY